MRTRSAVAKAGKTRDTPQEILTEGLAEGSHKTFMLCGKQYALPMRGKMNISWATMTSEELLEFARAYCKENGITKRSELQKGPKSLSNLYYLLSQKELGGINLIDLVFPRKYFEEMTLDGKTFRIPLDNKGDRNWAVMTPEALLEFAKAYCKENEIDKISELVHGPKALWGLYDIIGRRKLDGKKIMDLIFPRKEFEEMILGGRTFRIPLNTEGRKSWAVMTSEALVEFAKAYCREKGITKRMELAKGSKSLGWLYVVLKQKELNGIKLLSIVFPRKEFEEMIWDDKTFRIPLNTEGKRNWAAMSSEALVNFTKAYFKDRSITTREELRIGSKSAAGLYKALRKKGLLDQVFTEIGKSRDAATLSDLADALKSFEGSSK